MIDGIGRNITYLRISVTDRCNLRCAYCMPKNGICAFPHSEILSFEEIERLVRIMSGAGIKKVRLTGGEPLVRKDVAKLVKMISGIPGIDSLNITTNGILLPEYAHELKQAGLFGVNISLDTLNPAHFERISGGGNLADVLHGIDAGIAEGFKIKLNAVPVKGYNDDDIVSLCSFASEKNIDIRIIELMPIGEAVNYRGITSEKLISRLSEKFGEPEPLGREDSPAMYYQFPALKNRVGFIQPLSNCFCAECNRIRLTADGFLKLCLHHKKGIDVKSHLRSGKNDEEINKIITDAILEKPVSHNFTGQGVIVDSENRTMAQIGG
ncbi:MAG: GTP 3',8-cyclase MoaA [Treponema sp.]|nr:GTP 3',8-cyclase MoaA [Treponema sp.]